MIFFLYFLFIHNITEPLGHRNKILRSSLFLKNPLWLNTDETEKERIQKPSEFCCPIIKEIMNDPVVASGF